MNNMNVFQSNGLYYVFNEQGELKSMIYLPHDGQLLADFKTLDLMTGNGLSLGNLKTFKETQLIQIYVAYIKN